MGIDQLQLKFSPETLLLLNVILGFVIFGVALNLKIADFKRVLKMPKEIMVGLIGQLLLLPALTVLLILLFKPLPSLALGMVLVACCPGGNISNFLTHFSKGNAALSVTLTSFATLFSIILTPLSFYFWSGVSPITQNIMQSIDLPIGNMIFNVFILIALPLALGILISEKKESIAIKLKKPMQVFSLFFFGVFVVIALYNNWDNFLNYIQDIFLLVFSHNLLAFAIGFSLSTLFGIKLFEKKAITLEVGIQNSGLGLLLIFSYFNGMGGMALIAAFWGIWHIVSGFLLALVFRRI